MTFRERSGLQHITKLKNVQCEYIYLNTSYKAGDKEIFFNFCLSIWRLFSIHTFTSSVTVFISPTHAYVFFNYDISRFPKRVSRNITKASVPTCARSSKYIHKSTVWRKVNGAEEVCMHLFLAQVHCIPFHSVLFSNRRETISTFLVFRRSLQVKIQSDVIPRPSVRLPETGCQRYNILWIFVKFSTEFFHTTTSSWSDFLENHLSESCDILKGVDKVTYNCHFHSFLSDLAETQYKAQAVYRQATRNSHREWQYQMLHVYNCILLKMSTWGLKHVQENSILWMSNKQWIKLVINM